MRNEKKVIAIIPARGGSKRFPGKNIHSLNGKPLISYPIEAAKQAKFIDKVIVSTDDDQIALVAREYGAEVPFMRPEELSTDTSPVVDTIIYTLNELKKIDEYRPDYVLLLQATTPLIEPEQIDSVVELAFINEADSVVSLSEVNTINHPYNIREISGDGIAKFWQEDFHYEYLTKPKKKFYHVANMWLSSYDVLTRDRKLEGKKNYPYFVNSIYSMDIDYKQDLEMIEAWLQYKKTNI